MVTIGVLGANGMLGHTLARYFELKRVAVTRITREVFDVSISPFAELEKLIKHPGQVLINCIVSNPKSSAYQEAIEVNALFPRRLAYFCTENNIRLIHISTDGVFSGSTGNYCENHAPNANDVYGLSKLLGENDQCMVLRTSIIGREKSSSKYFLEWAISQRGKTVNGFTNHYWNGLTTLALAQAIEVIIGSNQYCKGLFHLYSDKALSKFDLLSLVNQTYNLDLLVEPIEAPQTCNRTLASIHQLSSKIVRRGLLEQLKELKAWDDAL